VAELGFLSTLGYDARMKHFYIYMLLILVLAGCSGGTQTSAPGLTPMPKFQEPNDAALHEAMQRYLKAQNAPAQSMYDIARVDLNGDKRRDGLALMKLPHHYWCDWAGCPLLVFKAGATDFTFQSSTQNVRGPIFISRETSQNWRKIIVRASGSNTPDRNVSLDFNGRAYTKNALSAPTYGANPSSTQMDKFFR